jgi:DNA-binding LytR/AlgR family response regulator
LKQLKAQSKSTGPNDFIFVTVDYSQVKLKFNDIIMIEGLRDYLKIHLHSSKSPLVVRGSLKSIEAELPSDQFIRVHKSYLLSIENITAVRRNSVFIKDLELPIGETYRESVDRLTKRNM